MRLQSTPHLNPQPRVTPTPREPGPDPRPRKRRHQAAPQEVVDQATEVKSGQPANTEVKVKCRKGKGKGCGSRKPRYVLTRSLVRLVLQEGLNQLAEDRLSNQAQDQSLPEEEDYRTKLERELAESEKPEPPKEPEQHLILSIKFDDNGQEIGLTYRDRNGKEVVEESRRSLSLSETLEARRVKDSAAKEVENKKKILELLREMKDFKISISFRDLVAAAMKDPQIKQLIRESAPPKQPYQDRSSSSKMDAKNGRPTFASSHTPRGKKKSRLH